MIISMVINARIIESVISNIQCKRTTLDRKVKVYPFSSEGGVIFYLSAK